MAFVAPVAGESLLIKVGDGGIPETFTHPCLINTDRAFEGSANTTTTEVADCATPSNPAKTVRVVKSVDYKVSGAGVLDATSANAYWAWLAAGTQKNVKVTQNLAGSAGGWTQTIPMVLTGFSVSGTRGDKQTCTISLMAADAAVLSTNAG